jgi:hypothetical protein
MTGSHPFHLRQRSWWLLLLVAAPWAACQAAISSAAPARAGIGCGHQLPPCAADAAGLQHATGRQLRQIGNNTGTVTDRCGGAAGILTWLQTAFQGVGTISNVSYPAGSCQQVGVASLANGSPLGPDGSSMLLMSSGKVEQVLQDPNSPPASTDPNFMNTNFGLEGSPDFGSSADAAAVRFTLTVTGSLSDAPEWLTLQYVFGSREYAAPAGRALEGALISIAPADQWPAQRRTVALVAGRPTSIVSFTSADARFTSNLPPAGTLATPLAGFGEVRPQACAGMGRARAAPSLQPHA